MIIFQINQMPSSAFYPSNSSRAGKEGALGAEWLQKRDEFTGAGGPVEIPPDAAIQNHWQRWERPGVKTGDLGVWGHLSSVLGSGMD